MTIYSLRRQVLEYVKEKYDTTPESLWKSYPTYQVIRHAADPSGKKGKWYGIFMDVKRSTLGLRAAITDESRPLFGSSSGNDDYVDILNVKLDPDLVSFLCQSPGYLPAYHMNKQGWISILLDGSVSFDRICQHIDESFAITALKSGKRTKDRGPRGIPNSMKEELAFHE